MTGIPAHESVYELYEQFRHSVVLVEIGQWGREQFGHWLEGMARRLGEREAALRNMDIPADLFDAFMREMEVGFQGIERVNEGVETMRRYVDGADPEVLWQGLEEVRRGNDLVNEAMRLNRESRSRDGTA